MIKLGDEDSSAVDRSKLTFEELVKLKALNQERMYAIRANWRAEGRKLSSEEWEQADERFRVAAEKIASQFGRSRAFVKQEKKPS